MNIVTNSFSNGKLKNASNRQSSRQTTAEQPHHKQKSTKVGSLDKTEGGEPENLNNEAATLPTKKEELILYYQDQNLNYAATNQNNDNRSNINLNKNNSNTMENIHNQGGDPSINGFQSATHNKNNKSINKSKSSINNERISGIDTGSGDIYNEEMEFNNENNLKLQGPINYKSAARVKNLKGGVKDNQNNENLLKESNNNNNSKPKIKKLNYNIEVNKDNYNNTEENKNQETNNSIKISNKNRNNNSKLNNDSLINNSKSKGNSLEKAEKTFNDLTITPLNKNSDDLNLDLMEFKKFDRINTNDLNVHINRVEDISFSNKIRKLNIVNNHTPLISNPPSNFNNNKNTSNFKYNNTVSDFMENDNEINTNYKNSNYNDYNNNTDVQSHLSDYMDNNINYNPSNLYRNLQSSREKYQGSAVSSKYNKDNYNYYNGNNSKNQRYISPEGVNNQKNYNEIQLHLSNLEKNFSNNQRLNNQNYTYEEWLKNAKERIHNKDNRKNMTPLNFENKYLKVDFKNKDLEKIGNVRDLQYTHCLLKEKVIKDATKESTVSIKKDNTNIQISDPHKFQQQSHQLRNNNFHIVKTRLSDIRHMVDKPTHENIGKTSLTKHHKNNSYKITERLEKELASGGSYLELYSPGKYNNNIFNQSNNSNLSKDLILAKENYSNNFSNFNNASNNHNNNNLVFDALSMNSKISKPAAGFASSVKQTKTTIMDKDYISNFFKENNMFKNSNTMAPHLSHHDDVVKPSNELDSEEMKLSRMKEDMKAKIRFNK